jgi:hypothetical protein
MQLTAHLLTALKMVESPLNVKGFEPASLEPGKQFLADQFQTLFEPVILKSQIKHQVLDAPHTKLVDLFGAVIGISDN